MNVKFSIKIYETFTTSFLLIELKPITISFPQFLSEKGQFEKSETNFLFNKHFLFNKRKWKGLVDKLQISGKCDFS